MFIRVLKNAFSRWWDKMAYTFITSFLGAINPFYLYLLATILIWFMPENKLLFVQSAEQFWLFLPPIILMTPVFPTSFAAIATQKKLLESDIMYFKQYFPEYFRSLAQTIKPSLWLSLIYGVTGFLLSYASVFYYKLLPHPALQIGAIVLMFWIYLLILLSQFVLIPLICYNPQLKIKESITLSFKMVLAQGLTILGVAAINLIIHIFLTLSRALGIFFYFGISSHLRIYMHKEIIAKYAPPAEKEEDHYGKIDATQNWADVLKRFEKEEQ